MARQALAVVEGHVGGHHPALCAIHTEVADGLLAVGNTVAACQHIAIARDLASTVLGPSHREVARLASRLASAAMVSPSLAFPTLGCAPSCVPSSLSALMWCNVVLCA